MDTATRLIQEMWDTAPADAIMHHETNDSDTPRPTGARVSTLVVCPHTDLQPATKIFLAEARDGNVAYHRMEGEYAYSRLLKQMWDRGDDFIIVEQDVVPFGGALRQLADCEHDWCLCGYHDEVDFSSGSTTYLGFVKIGKRLIEATPGLWRNDIHWSKCDQHLDATRSVHDITPHQHYPHVLNANPNKVTSPITPQP